MIRHEREAHRHRSHQSSNPRSKAAVPPPRSRGAGLTGPDDRRGAREILRALDAAVTVEQHRGIPTAALGRWIRRGRSSPAPSDDTGSKARRSLAGSPFGQRSAAWWGRSSDSHRRRSPMSSFVPTRSSSSPRRSRTPGTWRDHPYGRRAGADAIVAADPRRTSSIERDPGVPRDDPSPCLLSRPQPRRRSTGWPSTGYRLVAARVDASVVITRVDCRCRPTTNPARDRRQQSAASTAIHNIVAATARRRHACAPGHSPRTTAVNADEKRPADGYRTSRRSSGAGQAGRGSRFINRQGRYLDDIKLTG